jgi:toxin ParE1/3/4
VKIAWADAALGDLNHIESYIQEDNPTAAIDVVLSIIDSAEKLADNPYIGRAGRVHASREWVVSDTPYIIAYGVEKQTLTVFRVLHGAQQWPDEF